MFGNVTTPNPPPSELGPIFDAFSAEHQEVLTRLSHELRAPLTSVTTFARLLLGSVLLEQEGRPPTLTLSERVEALEAIVSETERLRASIERLLEPPQSSS